MITSINTHFCCSFLRDVFFCVCAYVEAWFPIGVVDNTVVQSCLNSWTRHVLFWISTQRHVFFIVARIFRQSFSFHIGILKGSSFFLGLALECWCAQPFTFPFILYCLIVSLSFFFKFSAFSLELEVQKASVLIIWILFRCFKKLFLSGNFSLGNLVNWFFQHIVKLPDVLGSAAVG